MYNAYDIHLLYMNGMCGALSNICHGNGRNGFSTVIDLRDAVEDSDAPYELLENISALNLVGFCKITVDRDTPEYTRLKGSDGFGNIHYLNIGKKV